MPHDGHDHDDHSELSPIALRVKALESLGEEGVTQVFKPVYGGDLVVGAVGQLQFEVLDERMKAEYGLEVIFETSPWRANISGAMA